MIIDDRLIEQTRRWLTRTIFDFYHTPMSGKSDEEFEQWHEDKAKEFLAFLNMSDAERMEAVRKLNVDSSNPKRIKCLY